MSDAKQKILCLVCPDDAPLSHLFEVQVCKNQTLITLKDLIKARRSLTFSSIEAVDLTLWKCSGFPKDDDGLEQALQSVQFDGSDDRLVPLLSVRHPISDYFGDADADLSEEPVHILIKAPVPQRPAQPSHENDLRSEDEGKDEADDQLTDLVTVIHKKYRRILEKNQNAPPPSTSAKSGGYITFQNDGDPIYDGRYVATSPSETRAPPVQIYHSVFGHFQDDLSNPNLEVPTKVVRDTARLMGVASGIYKNEENWRASIRPILLDVLGLGMEKVVNVDMTSADGLIMTQALALKEVAAILIEEDKNEFGDGGSDPSTQAALSYGRFWAQSNHSNIRENTCSPSFLIAIAGASIAILGAVWTDKIIVQRLTDYIWLGHDTVFNDDAIYRNARFLHALRRSLHRLEAFYKTLEIHHHPDIPGKLAPRYFPSIKAYCRPDNTIINFTFVVPLEYDSVCTTFLAKTEGPASQSIVVKFVRRYNKEAHELLAAQHMAPKLHYCGKVGIHVGDPSYGHLRMVVMDFVDGKTMDHMKTFPPTFPRRIREILDVLHQADYVFGDLRGPNIMITKNNEVMFIDFDMVGKHGVSRYPIMMSPSIEWPKGVGDGLGVMLKEHDLEMLQRLFQEYCA